MKPLHLHVTLAALNHMAMNGSRMTVMLFAASLGASPATIGVLAALQHRSRNGDAVAVDLSMLDSLLSFLSYMVTYFFVSGESFPRIGNNNRSVVPYGRFPVADGHIILEIGRAHV